MLHEIARQLLDELSQIYREHESLTDDILSALHVVFQAPLLPALDLVDHHKVTRLTSPSGRTVCQVIGSSGTPYTCLTSTNYCDCPAYQFSVLKNEDQLMCKHLLAVHLSIAMEKCGEQSVTDEDITTYLKHMGAFSNWWRHHLIFKKIWDRSMTGEDITLFHKHLGAVSDWWKHHPVSQGSSQMWQTYKKRGLMNVLLLWHHRSQ